MGQRRSNLVLMLVLGASVLGGGCSRQDTELLGNIGRKLMDRAGTATANYREKIDHVLHHRDGPPLEKKEE